MHPIFLRQQLLLAFHMGLVGQAAVYRADGSALGLVVEALALGALVGDDEIKFVGNRGVVALGIDLFTPQVRYHAFQPGAVGKTPGLGGGVDGVVGAFGNAGVAVDAIFRDLNSHILVNLIIMLTMILAKFGCRLPFVLYKPLLRHNNKINVALLGRLGK